MMKCFVSRDKVFQEYHMVKDIGDNEFTYEPRYYEFYKQVLKGKILERIEKLENAKKSERQSFGFIRRLGLLW